MFFVIDAKFLLKLEKRNSNDMLKKMYRESVMKLAIYNPAIYKRVKRTFGY